MIHDLITVLESNAFLSRFEDWIDEMESEKEYHINRASVYVQTAWVCVNINWADDTTISDTIKMAISFYAYADFHGALYGNIAGGEVISGRIKSSTDKVGSLTTSRTYSGGASVSKIVLGYPDSLMMSECTRLSNSSLVRS